MVFVCLLSVINLIYSIERFKKSTSASITKYSTKIFNPAIITVESCNILNPANPAINPTITTETIDVIFFHITSRFFQTYHSCTLLLVSFQHSENSKRYVLKKLHI